MLATFSDDKANQHAVTIRPNYVFCPSPPRAPIYVFCPSPPPLSIYLGLSERTTKTTKKNFCIVTMSPAGMRMLKSALVSVVLMVARVLVHDICRMHRNLHTDLPKPETPISIRIPTSFLREVRPRYRSTEQVEACLSCKNCSNIFFLLQEIYSSSKLSLGGAHVNIEL